MTSYIQDIHDRAVKEHMSTREYCETHMDTRQLRFACRLAEHELMHMQHDHPELSGVDFHAHPAVVHKVHKVHVHVKKLKA